MKNRQIEEKLNRYAEAVKPGEDILAPALAELRKTPYRSADVNAPKKPQFFKRLIAVAALLVCSVILYNIVVLYLPADDPPVSYALSSLVYTSGDFDAIRATDEILTLPLPDAYTNARVYTPKNGGDAVLISVLYKTVGENGQDEIVVLADLTGGLTDYKDFRFFPETSVNGGERVAKNVRHEDGEYYTDAYFTRGAVNYYVMITSPAADTADAYLAMLLG